MTNISFRESNGRATTIKTGEIESGIVVPGVQLYAKDPNGDLIPVTADADGNFVISVGAVTVDNVEISNDEGNPVPALLTQVPGLGIPTHDYISLTYTGSDITGVVYKTGGSSGTTVATLTLAYSDSKLVSVTKS